jgi:Family of unknown function (DUF6480)
MTATPPDPDPADTPAVANGGGVEPGDTPPDSAQTSGTNNQDPPATRRFTPTTIASLIVVGVLAAIFLVVAVIYLLQIMGVMDRW